MSTTEHLIITGAKNPVGQAVPPERKEINDLIQNDPVGFSLFVRAFAEFKKGKRNDDASYYQIAGIHGHPYVAWQGAGGAGDPDADKSEKFLGYCTHSSTIFATWHRPYLALFEQILVKHARDVAASWPADWQAKAESLRLPFWDWASRIAPPKEILGDEKQLSILKPDGTTESFENPFFNYHFEDPVPAFTDGHSDTFENPSLSEVYGRAIRRDTFKVLIEAKDWSNFAHDRASQNPVTLATSLEQIHNSLHNNIGNGGFMSDASISAFDPIFWFHHANVDRILALWQVIHPNKWVTPSKSSWPTWDVPPGTYIDAQTALTPFWDGKTNESFWTSKDVVFTSTFGYTYPELKSNPSPSQLQQVVTALYGEKTTKAFSVVANSIPNSAPEAETLRVAAESLSKINLADLVPDLQLDVHPVEEFTIAAKGVLGALVPGVAQSNAAGAEAEPLEVPVEALEAARQRVDEAEAPVVELAHNRTGLQNWAVRVQFEKFALRTSFDVVIFLLPDDVDAEAISSTDSRSWLESEYYVGSVSAFVNSTPEQCPNCVRNIEEGTKIEGFVSLNEAIVEITGLTSFEDEVVHPYLKKNLAWRVRKVSDGSIVPLEDIPSLEVTVWSSALLFFPDNAWHLPTFEAPKHHRGITAGQLGGCAAESSDSE